MEDLPPPEDPVEPPDDVVLVVAHPSVAPDGGGGGDGRDGKGVELFGNDAIEAPGPTTFIGSHLSKVPPTDVPGLEWWPTSFEFEEEETPLSDLGAFPTDSEGL